MNKKTPILIKRIYAAFFLMVLLPLSIVSWAQTVEVNLVDTEVYPRVKVYVTVVQTNGDVICKLDPGTFRLNEHDRPRKLSLLYGEATETSIGILLDGSGSMHGVIDDVRAAAKQFIQVMGGTDRACIYSFDDVLHRLYSMIDVSIGTNKTTLTMSLDNYVPGGGTSMYTAINALINQEMAKETERRKAIVALTDGVSSGMLKTALEATAKYNVSVYTIGMGSVDVQALQELAEKSGGKFYAVSAKPTAQELTKVYKDIRNRLNCQYTLIYETPDICPDGADVPIQVFVDRFGISKKATYKRPHDPARIVHNIFFAPKEKPRLVVIPGNPMECEVVEFHTSLQSTSCSDSFVLKNIVVRAYDVRPGDRIEVAKSDPIEIQSNSTPKKVVVKWNTRGYTDTRQIQLVIDPSDEILERIEEDNLIDTRVKVSKAIHDLYIKEIEYSPKPASPCKPVNITVRVSDGCTCEGVKSNEIFIEALDDKKQSIGTDIVTVTSGQLSEVKFQWDPEGRIGHIPLTFKVDPRGQFGQEQTLKNNNMQKLIEISPVLHELKPTQVPHPKKRFFVGDEIPFKVNVENGGICPGLKMHQKIRIRLKDAESNRVLAHSEPFALDTQTSIIVPANWKTKRNDGGARKLKFTVDAEGIVRERQSPGKQDNSIDYQLEILPMPHDLVIKSAVIEPERPVDGDPATIKVVIEDNARFDGIKLPQKFKIRAFERYTRMALGTSDPADIFSRQTAEIHFLVDTGGLAGKREILVKVDPDNEIQELTPKGLDGENNNEYILHVTINE